MRVLFVMASDPTTENHAVGVFVKEHARAVAAHADVAVVHLDRGGARSLQIDQDELEEFPTWRVRYPSSPALLSYAGNALGTVLGYRRAKRIGFDPDVLHAHFFLAGAPTVLLGRLIRKPVVVTEQWSVFLPGDPASLSPLVRRVARLAFEHADYVLPVSEALRDGIAAAGINARFRVVPNVFDERRFHPGERPSASNGGTRRILSVGALYEAKGWEHLLEAVALLERERDDFRLEIVGDGPGRPDYEALRQRLGLEQRVQFSGWKTKDDVATLMRAADVFVLASRYDSNPCALIEALASGLPVVATAVGGIPEMVEPGWGRLATPENPASLAAELAAVLDQPDRYDRAAIANGARARYGSETVGRELAAIYDEVIHARRSR
jgi:L-malate glycosyltransferase